MLRNQQKNITSKKFSMSVGLYYYNYNFSLNTRAIYKYVKIKILLIRELESIKYIGIHLTENAKVLHWKLWNTTDT